MKSNMNAQPTYEAYATATATEVHAVPISPAGQAINGFATVNPPPPPTAPSAPTAPGSIPGIPGRGEINDGGAREFLSQYSWPPGLQEVFVQNLNKIPLRYYICDDSGSMSANDGHKMVSGSQGIKMVSCSRWEELTCSLKFLAGAAKAAGAPTQFRMLNGSAPIWIGTGDPEDAGRFTTLLGLLNDSPGGGTPLCRHVREVIAQIRPMEAQLRANGQKVCVVIASDGESSDGNVAEALRPLKDLPVWVVVRLCTDEDRIVDYWNNIDSELELEMDVLDDFSGEAKELHTHNPWLAYGEPMHRLREFGIPVKEIDLMDETKLSLDQIRRICCTIFGGRPDDYPHPEADWDAFVAAVQKQNSRTPKIWNPVSKRLTEWINLSQLNSAAGKGGCALS